jgi:hypothetical protein
MVGRELSFSLLSMAHNESPVYSILGKYIDRQVDIFEIEKEMRLRLFCDCEFYMSSVALGIVLRTLSPFILPNASNLCVSPFHSQRWYFIFTILLHTKKLVKRSALYNLQSLISCAQVTAIYKV